nr:uncharacterized protein LOC113819765 [Penaeus vannamei]
MTLFPSHFRLTSLLPSHFASFHTLASITLHFILIPKYFSLKRLNLQTPTSSYFSFLTLLFLHFLTSPHTAVFLITFFLSQSLSPNQPPLLPSSAHFSSLQPHFGSPPHTSASHTSHFVSSHPVILLLPHFRISLLLLFYSLTLLLIHTSVSLRFYTSTLHHSFHFSFPLFYTSALNTLSVFTLLHLSHFVLYTSLPNTSCNKVSIHTFALNGLSIHTSASVTLFFHASTSHFCSQYTYLHFCSRHTFNTSFPDTSVLSKVTVHTSPITLTLPSLLLSLSYSLTTF